jgi:Asp-tRNA(Asn)/Glu-tRNA(Gln) amidotransferase A subunit family amidase
MAEYGIPSHGDIIHRSASELADAIKAGDLSAEEVVDTHIRHIETVNPALNAVVIPLFDEARAKPSWPTRRVRGASHLARCTACP